MQQKCKRQTTEKNESVMDQLENKLYMDTNKTQTGVCESGEIYVYEIKYQKQSKEEGLNS